MRGDAIPLKRTAVAQRLSVKRKVTGRQHIAAVNGIDRIQRPVALAHQFAGIAERSSGRNIK